MGTPEVPGIMLPMWLADHTHLLPGGCVSLSLFCHSTDILNSHTLLYSSLGACLFSAAGAKLWAVFLGLCFDLTTVGTNTGLMPGLLPFGDSSIGIRQRCNTVKSKCPIYSNGNFHYLLCENHKLGDQAVLRLIFFPQSRGIWIVGEGL